MDQPLPDYGGVVRPNAHSVYDRIYGENKAAECGCSSDKRKYWLEALRVDPGLVREVFHHNQTLFVIGRASRGARPRNGPKCSANNRGPL